MSRARERERERETTSKGNNNNNNNNSATDDSHVDYVAVAKVVDEDELMRQMEEQSGERIREQILKGVVQAEAKPDDDDNVFRIKYRVAIVITLGSVLGAILLGILIPRQKDSAHVQTDFEYLLDIFTSVSGRKALVDKTTPQYQALQWLTQEDGFWANLSIQNTSSQVLIDRYTLAVFYLVTDGPTWTDQMGFFSNTSVCEWNTGDEDNPNGVGCNVEGAVTSVFLRKNNLNGTLPTEMGSLESIQAIAISGNGAVHGKIPTELGRLEQLTSLILYHELFTGTIPDVLGQLTGLRKLDLDMNFLSGDIPPSVTQLPLLEQLSLRGNALTGTIPDFRPYGPVKVLGLEENQLEGSIPASIYSLEDLEYIGLSMNSLNGTLSSQIGKLTSLEDFFVFENNLSGALPTFMGQLKSAVNVEVDYNSFNGTLPTELGNLRDLEVLYLHANDFSGPIPSQFGQLTSLTVLSVAGTEITGRVPSEVAALPLLMAFIGFNTSLQEGFDNFCNRDVPLLMLESDCGDSPSQANCTCCTKCCSDTTGECKPNILMACEGEKAGIEALYAGNCSCSDSGEQVRCHDNECIHCTRDEFTCYRIREYTTNLVWDPEKQFFFFNSYTEGEYVDGPYEGTVFRIEWASDTSCRVLIDGELCDSCYYSDMCPNGSEQYVIDCRNVQDDLFLDGCNTLSNAGALEVFTDGNDLYQDTCVPFEEFFA
mmetsp:Transcript_4166/g.8448  ORF Transcript_4166/g.8448 Transcript_4166/m.8448 type:complete len:710 (-) Transcript_4166:2306-4435(-)